jgi:hypothetical protein
MPGTFRRCSRVMPESCFTILRIVSRVTVFAAGIPTTATHPEAAKALIELLAARQAA